MYQTDTYMVDYGLADFWSVYLMFTLAFSVCAMIANYWVFTQAGEKGWKSFIPFYNSYITTKITFGEEKAIWFLLMFAPVIGSIFEMYLLFMQARTFGKGDSFAICHALFAPITTFILWGTKAEYKGPEKFIF